MIAVDTSFLLRLLLRDDVIQFAKAERELVPLGESSGGVYINDVVLAETAWALAGPYGYPRADILRTLQSLIGNAAFAFENREVLIKATKCFANTKAGFADCLVAVKNEAAGCLHTISLDKDMRGLPGVRLI